MKNNVDLVNEFIETIKAKTNEIMKNSKEKDTIIRAKEMIDYINQWNDSIENDRTFLAKNIENSMKEAKNRNSEMESILYIIHGDLINSRISVEKARELYEQYLNLELFENKLR